MMMIMALYKYIFIPPSQKSQTFLCCVLFVHMGIANPVAFILPLNHFLGLNRVARFSKLKYRITNCVLISNKKGTTFYAIFETYL